MKTISILIFAVLAAVFSGCATTPKPSAANIPPLPPGQFASEVVGMLAQGVVPIVLEKNPGYAGTVETVANLVPVVLGTAQLTPQGISDALTSLNAQAHLGMTPDVTALLASTLSIALLEYERTYGVPLALNTDPGVQLVLNGFATGLRNGVGIWRGAHPSSP